jgi:hypothetical protein
MFCQEKVRARCGRLAFGLSIGISSAVMPAVAYARGRPATASGTISGNEVMAIVMAIAMALTVGLSVSAYLLARQSRRLAYQETLDRVLNYGAESPATQLGQRARPAAAGRASPG